MITRKGLIHFLIVTILLAATITSSSIPIVYAPAAFTAVDTLDLYDCVNEGRVSVINTNDLYIGTTDDYMGAKIAKIDLTTFTKAANITLPQNEDDIYDMIISGDYLYAAHYNYPAQITKIKLSTFERVDVLTFESGEYGAVDQVIVGSNLYVLLNTPPAKIVRVNLTDFTYLDNLTLSEANNEYYGTRLLYEGSGDMIYAVTQSPFESPIYEALRVVKINVTSFSRIAAINFNNGIETYGYAACINGSYLYVGTKYSVGMTNSRVIKIDLSSFTRVATLDFPSSPSNYATSHDMVTDGTFLYVKMGQTVHYLHRVNISSFTWYGSAISYVGTTKNSLSISGGYLYSPNLGTWTTVYKVDLSSFAIDDTLPLYVGVNADYIVGVKADTTYLYALCQMSSGASKISKVDLATFELVTTQALGATEDEAEGFELYNGYLYVGVDNGTDCKILKIDTATLATVETAILVGDSNLVHSLHVADDGYLYAAVYQKALHKLDPSNLNAVANMTLLDGEDDPYALASDGTYLYVVTEADSDITQIGKIDLATFTRVDTLTLDAAKHHPRSCDYDNGYLYIACFDYPSAVSKIDVATMVEVDFELLPVDEEGAFGCTVFLGHIYIGVDFDSPDGATVVKLETSTLDRVDGLTLNYSNKERYIGDMVVATVGADVYLFVGLDDRAPAKIVQVYLASTVDCTFASNPEINAPFTIEGTEYTTPDTIPIYEGSNVLVATLEVEYNEVAYIFTSWLVNGTNYYYTLQHTVNLSGNTSFILNYEVKGNPPIIPPIFDPEAINATWFMRSDTHTIHEILGYKLHEYQSYTEANETRYYSTETLPISYGVRIFALDADGDVYELSSGVPVAVVTRDDNSSGILSETWTCSEFMNIVDAVQVKVYQRFGIGDWSLRRIFITEETMLIRFPAGTWTFYYYVEQIKGSTNSTFSHGSLSFNSRMNFQYYRISVFEKMTYHIQQFQILSFFVTPWTYYLGSMFYGILLFFFAATAYLRYHSLRAVLAVFWLFGGTGGFLSAMMPAMGLQLSWLILAFSLAITIFHLVYGRRT